MRYEGRIYRPPSEAGSYILQATIGCSWNHCTYCDMYRAKRFPVRDLGETLADEDAGCASWAWKLSAILLLGAGGTARSQEQAEASARPITAIDPAFCSASRDGSVARRPSHLEAGPEWELPVIGAGRAARGATRNQVRDVSGARRARGAVR